MAGTLNPVGLMLWLPTLDPELIQATFTPLDLLLLLWTIETFPDFLSHPDNIKTHPQFPYLFIYLP
jgi:hypothetical protein